MTEADTYTALKRIPYEQMRALWRAEHWFAEDNFFEQQGWTYDEFRAESTKRYNDRG
jgi:hypothetical protein